MPNGLPSGARPQPNSAMQNGSVPVGINGVPMAARVHPQGRIPAQQMTNEQLTQLRNTQLAKQAAQGQPGYSQAQLPGMQSGFPVGTNASQQAVKVLMLQAQQAALGGQKMANVPNGQAGSPRMQNQPLNQQQQQQAAG